LSVPADGGPLRRGWRRAAGFLFVAAAFLFLGLYVAGNMGTLRAHPWNVRFDLLVLSLGSHVAGLAWGVRVWQLLLARMGASVGYLDLARVWFISSLGRYIPGKIWQFVGAAQLGGDAGIPRTVVVTSLAAHTGFFIVGAAMVGVYLLPLGAEVGMAYASLLHWLAPLGLLLVHPRVIEAALAVVRRTTGRRLEAWNGRWIDGIVLVALSVVGWLITGFALYLFVGSLTPIPLTAAPVIIGMNALAFVVGHLVFLAPAGLGAKEGALTVLLSIYVTPPVAALLAVATRLWTIVAEVLPALLLMRRRPAGPLQATAPQTHRAT
jgi:glycosyltransferase 2 family protein